MFEIFAQIPSIIAPRAPIVVEATDYAEALLASPFVILKELRLFVALIQSNTETLVIGWVVLFVLFSAAFITWWYFSRHTVTRKRMVCGALGITVLYYAIGMAAAFVSLSTAGVAHGIATTILLLALVPVYFSAAALLVTAIVRRTKQKPSQQLFVLSLGLFLVYLISLFLSDSYWKSFGEPDGGYMNPPTLSIPTGANEEKTAQEYFGPLPQEQSPAVLAALQELEEYSFLEGDITWENEFGTGRTFGPYMFRIGDEIYSRYDDEENPELMVVVDESTFVPDPILTVAREYSPVVDGGYRPHYYRDKDFFYCGIGRKGPPDVHTILLPVELEFIPLSQTFTASDGLSDEERRAWQSRESGEYFLANVVGSNGRQYSLLDCEIAQ